MASLRNVLLFVALVISTAQASGLPSITERMTLDEFVDSVSGTYENFLCSASAKSAWPYVTISKIDSSTLKWSNGAGISWTLFVKRRGTTSFDMDILDVDTDNPYYKAGHTEATVLRNSQGDVVTIIGPMGEPYTRTG